jgi:hypothetical protein
MSVTDVFRKSLPPPRVAQANLIAAQNTPRLAELHPRIRGNVDLSLFLATIPPKKCLEGQKKVTKLEVNIGSLTGEIRTRSWGTNGLYRDARIPYTTK